MKAASITITKLTGKKSLSQVDSIFIGNESKDIAPVDVTSQIKIAKKGMSFTELSISKNDRIEPIIMSQTQAILMSSSIPGQQATTSTDIIIVTDNNGYYEVMDLLPGNYSLTTTVTDYDSYQVNVTQPKGPINKDITLLAKALPQVSSLTLSDVSKSITATWTALTNSTVKGYNAYEKHFLWYQAEMEEDEQYLYPKYNAYAKANPASISSNSYAIPTEDYNGKYWCYILPVNIDNFETQSGTTTITKYMEVPKKVRTLQSFSLIPITGSKVFIPATSNHEIALHMQYYYASVTQTLQLNSWKVQVSLDGITWTTVGTHTFPSGLIPMENYGYITTYSLNSYKGLSIYLRTDPTAFPEVDNRPIIANTLNEYSQDGTNFQEITLPVAAFTANSTTITAGGSVQFTDQSTNSPTIWLWDFGDGGTSTSKSPAHTYITAGTYSVNLTATNGFGSNTKTISNYITVNTGPVSAPVANFMADQTTIATGGNVQFTDLSTNNPTVWLWNFGDGGTSTSKSPTHTYTTAGTYNVSLTATNGSGSNTKTTSNYITVIPQVGNGIIFNPNLIYGSVNDNDGNTYKTIQIGTQIWMAENLKTILYNDNTTIPLVTVDEEWEALSAPGPAYCWYNNDAVTYKATYGALYSWYAVDAASNGGRNVCPTNWHVPTDVEWTTLTTYLGGESVAGDKLKETGTTHWLSPNTGATNETGFTALPSGYRNFLGPFYNIGVSSSWWSSTEYFTLAAYYRYMTYYLSSVGNSYSNEHYGYPVRCLKDY